jgi:transcriptional regulator with XRE-family HTH domain
MTIQERIEYLLRKKGVSSYEIAQKTGISQSTLSRLRQGLTAKLNIKNAELLAKYFGIDKKWLLTGEGKPFSTSEHDTTLPVSSGNDALLLKLLDKKDSEIRELNREIGALSEQNRSLIVQAAQLHERVCALETEVTQLRDAPPRSVSCTSMSSARTKNAKAFAELSK